MKVLLCQDVEKLGWLGDVLDISPGYARNYLLPQGLAVIPTEANLKALAGEKARRAEERIRQRKRLEEIAAKVQGAEAVIAAKANEQGHLFGSVTAREIAANLREQGFAIPDETAIFAADDGVRLAGGGHGDRHWGGIKEVGVHEVTLKFAEDLSCKVSVVVVAEVAQA